jgi:hypothetical protein
MSQQVYPEKRDDLWERIEYLKQLERLAAQRERTETYM